MAHWHGRLGYRPWALTNWSTVRIIGKMGKWKYPELVEKVKPKGDGFVVWQDEDLSDDKRDEVLKDINSEFVRAVAWSATQNFMRLNSLAALPGVVAAHAFHSGNSEVKWGIEIGSEDVEGFAATIPSVRFGLESLYDNIVVGAWTAFETLAGDLWEQSLNSRPEQLARAAINSQSKRECDDFGDSQAGGIGKNPKLKFIESLIGAELAVADEIGTLLRFVRRFDFNRLTGIHDAYRCAFGKEVDSIFGGEPGAGLEVLHGLRNVFVHSAGRADRVYRDRFKKGRRKYEKFGLSDPSLDGKIFVDGAMVTKIIGVAGDATQILVHFVDQWLSSNPAA